MRIFRKSRESNTTNPLLKNIPFNRSRSIRSRALSRENARSIPKSRESRKPITRKNPMVHTVQRTRKLTNQEARELKKKHNQIMIRRKKSRRTISL